MKQKGLIAPRTILGTIVLIIVIVGAFYVGQIRSGQQSQSYGIFAKIIYKIIPPEVGSKQYCQQFSSATCPRQYCELSGPSCPMCLNVGRCIPRALIN